MKYKPGMAVCYHGFYLCCYGIITNVYVDSEDKMMITIFWKSSNCNPCGPCRTYDYTEESLKCYKIHVIE
jgi:hypothetical protein